MSDIALMSLFNKCAMDFYHDFGYSNFKTFNDYGRGELSLFQDAD